MNRSTNICWIIHDTVFWLLDTNACSYEFESFKFDPQINKKYSMGNAVNPLDMLFCSAETFILNLFGWHATAGSPMISYSSRNNNNNKMPCAASHILSSYRRRRTPGLAIIHEANERNGEKQQEYKFCHNITFKKGPCSIFNTRSWKSYQ